MLPRAIVLLWLCLALPVLAQPELAYEWGHPGPQGNTVFGFAFADASTGWAVCGGGGVLRTVDGGESWELLAVLPGAPHLYDLILRADGALLAVGEGAALFLSTDGGANWSAPAHAAPAGLRDLAALPGGGLSAVGEQGALLLSSDGGFTWTASGPPTADNLRQHCWTSDQDVFAVTDDGAWRSDDAGASWVQIVSGLFFGMNQVFFLDAQHGYLVEDFATWSTTDGGLTWTEHFDPTPPLYRFRTLPLSDTHWLLVTDIEGGELWESEDGGVTWTQHFFQPVMGYPCLVEAPGGRVFFGSDIGDLYYTDDFGATLHNAALNLAADAPMAGMDALIARPDGVLFAANKPSIGSQPQGWLRSDDGGRHWTAPADAPDFRWVADGAFLDEARGVVGSYGMVARTADGGETWQEALLPGDHRVHRFALPAADRFFVSTWTDTGGGGLLRSADGGATWTPVGGGLPTSLSGGGLDFVDAQRGWFSGLDGGQRRLYRTLDGGETWSLLPASGLIGSADDLHWLDAQTGLAAVRTGSVPGVYRSEDGGATWILVSEGAAARLAFRGALEGFATRSWYSAPRYTADAGVSWQEFRPPFDGGLPWLEDGNVHGIIATQEGWLFGGDRNRLLLGVDETLTAAPTGATPPGLAARIVGGHPNPFNPSTVLTVRAEQAGRLRLTLHDARGRRVRTLFAGALHAEETRELRWDGRDDTGRTLPSGLYLARLAGAGQADALKLMLLK